MMIPKDYVERVYAGWLGKVIGVRHGANIEGWSYDRIAKAYGEITDYPHDFTNFAADDDTNGPMFFLRALEDYTHTAEITAEQMGKTWLNYVSENHGFFWWGGYGVSTEHTAYLNLLHGIPAPRSGSTEQNGAAVAEQIGGQIFIDVWGLIAPGQPQLAAEYAKKIASVSHDGNGIYGGMFIAACIAQAFVEEDVERVIETGLAVIPSDCEYARVVKDIIRFYKENPSNWRTCYKHIFENWGYDRYPGNCHIIPNSAIMIMSLMYGQGDFSDTINICNMGGWDTDCNVANVACIIGVMKGLDGIDSKWRTPINDFICYSSVLGGENIGTLPADVTRIARLGYKIAAEEPGAPWQDILAQSLDHCHFELPGSTHAFRADSGSNKQGFVVNTTEEAFAGTRSLKVVFDGAPAGKPLKVFQKTYYTPGDFDDSRYDPCFSPVIYPGQDVQCFVKVPLNLTQIHLDARLYVWDRNSDSAIYGPSERLQPGSWQKLEFAIPQAENVCLSEVGVEFVATEDVRKLGDRASMIAYIDEFSISGGADYSVDFSSERLEKWFTGRAVVSQISYLRGLWTLQDGHLSGSYHPGLPAEAYTGSQTWSNYRFEAELVPKVGDCHNINFRVQGAIRSYAVGLDSGRVVLYKNNQGYSELTSVPFDWSLGTAYKVAVVADENTFKISVDGKEILSYRDDEQPYLTGQIGFSVFKGSHCRYKGFSVAGI